MMANYSFALWIALSAGLMVLFVYAAAVNLRRRNQPEVDLSDIVPYLLPVNVEVLAEAIDPSQDEYLRHSNSPEEFHRLQLKRARLAAEYLRRMSHNAELLQQVGYSQLRSPNPVISERAQELIDAGVHVRLYALLGLATLFCRRLWMVRSFSIAKVMEAQKLMSSCLIPAYDTLRSQAEGLTALRNTEFRDVLLHSL